MAAVLETLLLWDGFFLYAWYAKSRLWRQDALAQQALLPSTFERVSWFLCCAAVVTHCRVVGLTDVWPWPLFALLAFPLLPWIVCEHWWVRAKLDHVQTFLRDACRQVYLLILCLGLNGLAGIVLGDDVDWSAQWTEKWITPDELAISIAKVDGGQKVHLYKALGYAMLYHTKSVVGFDCEARKDVRQLVRDKCWAQLLESHQLGKLLWLYSQTGDDNVLLRRLKKAFGHVKTQVLTALLSVFTTWSLILVCQASGRVLKLWLRDLAVPRTGIFAVHLSSLETLALQLTTQGFVVLSLLLLEGQWPQYGRSAWMVSFAVGAIAKPPALLLALLLTYGHLLPVPSYAELLASSRVSLHTLYAVCGLWFLQLLVSLARLGHVSLAHQVSNLGVRLFLAALYAWLYSVTTSRKGPDFLVLPAFYKTASFFSTWQLVERHTEVLEPHADHAGDKAVDEAAEPQLKESEVSLSQLPSVTWPPEPNLSPKGLSQWYSDIDTRFFAALQK